MPIQITIIGLGYTGTSLGLAIKRRADSRITVVGHDRQLEASKQAQAQGAVDRADWNLNNACESADLIMLCVPLSALREALGEAAPFAKEGCVLSDTAPVKVPVLKWAAETLPAGRYFVGGSPVLNPAYVYEGLASAASAHADLFDRGMWALASTVDTPKEALKLVSDLVVLVGASPFFIGAAEHDALMAGVHALPVLLAAGLVGVAGRSPGWPDGRKLADRMFAAVTAPVSLSNPTAARAAAVLNRDEVVRCLDDAIKQLTALRGAVADGDADALDSLLTEAAIIRESWLKQRGAGDWRAAELPAAADAPPAGDTLRRMLGLGNWPGRNRKK